MLTKYMCSTGAGFLNERVHFLAANHREICKFQGIEDSNYISLKNTLGKAVSDLLQDSMPRSPLVPTAQCQRFFWNMLTRFAKRLPS